MVKIAICVGCGLAVNGSGVLIVDRNPDSVASGLECTDTLGLSLAIQHTPGTCVTTTGLGTTVSPLNVDINLADANSGLICDGTGLRVVSSPDDFNNLDIRGNGLWSKCPSSLVYTSPTLGYAGAAFPVGLNTGGLGEFSVVNFGGPFTVTNPFPWNMEGFWEFRAYGGWVRANNGFDGYAYVSSSIDGGAFGAAAPPTNFRMDNRGSGRTVDYEPSSLIDKNYIIFGANQSYTFELRTTIKCTAGTGNWLDSATGGSNPLFEFYLLCSPTGLC